MKYALLIIVALSISNDPVKTGKINSIKSEAKKAFNSGNYKTAIEKYKYLIDSLEVKEDEVMLNLAHAYYLEKDTANAEKNYQSLTASAKKEINSKAHNQLGLMTNKKGKAEEALNYFKQAIKADPTNDDARYNYEMLKKKLDERKKQEEKQQKQDQNKDQQQKDQQNKDQQNKDQQNKDQQKKDEQKKDQQNKDQQNKKDQEQQKKDQQQKEQQEKEQQQKEQQEKEQQEKEQQKNEEQKKEQQKKDMNMDSKKLEQLKMSPEKARMILEAMKNQEKQYLQQQKRKAAKARDRTKPDW